MQLWAKEDQERFHLEKQLKQQQDEIENEIKSMKNKEKLKKDYEINDLNLLNQDILETQTINQIIRKIGLSAGINSNLHQIQPEDRNENIRILYFKLNTNYNFNWKLKSQVVSDDILPFDIDLKLYKDVEILIGNNIGERGVLALAGEFIRGACTNIITLDLSR